MKRNMWWVTTGTVAGVAMSLLIIILGPGQIYTDFPLPLCKILLDSYLTR